MFLLQAFYLVTTHCTIEELPINTLIKFFHILKHFSTFATGNESEKNIMQKSISNIGDFDSVLNSLYGEPGTPKRKEFRREAYAYCVDMTTPAIDNTIQQGLKAYSSIRKKTINGELPDLTLAEINEEIRLYREEDSSTLGL